MPAPGRQCLPWGAGNIFSSWFRHLLPFPDFFRSFLRMPELSLRSARPHSLSRYFLRFTEQVDAGHLFLLRSHAFAKRCLLWIPLWQELSFPLIISLLHVCKLSLFFFLGSFTHRAIEMSTWTSSNMGRKMECDLGEPPTQGTGANGGSQGWFGVRDANMEKRLELLAFQDLRWERRSWKLGSCNRTTCHLFVSHCWPAFLARTSFLSGHCLLSLFSLLPMAVSLL